MCSSHSAGSAADGCALPLNLTSWSASASNQVLPQVVRTPSLHSNPHSSKHFLAGHKHSDSNLQKKSMGQMPVKTNLSGALVAKVTCVLKMEDIMMQLQLELASLFQALGDVRTKQLRNFDFFVMLDACIRMFGSCRHMKACGLLQEMKNERPVPGATGPHSIRPLDVAYAPANSYAVCSSHFFAHPSAKRCREQQKCRRSASNQPRAWAVKVHLLSAGKSASPSQLFGHGPHRSLHAAKPPSVRPEKIRERHPLPQCGNISPFWVCYTVPFLYCCGRSR